MDKHKNNAAALEYPDFFKVFLPEHNSQKMRIPDAFVKYLHGVVLKKAILESPRGRVWHVDICIDGGVYFDHGWKQFTMDNSLLAGNFLTFSFNGRNRFKFKIYKPNGCEVVETYNEEADEESGFVKEEAEEEENDDDYYDGDGDDDDDDDEYTEVEEEKEEQVNSGSRKRKCSSLNVSHRGSSSRARKIRIEDYGIDAEMYVQPDNPYFITKLGGNRDNELSIPNHIIRDYSLRLPERLTLRRCCKRLPKHEVQEQHQHLTLRLARKSTWEGKVVEWKDGRKCIRGWAAFCRCNGITDDDFCLCEFLLGEDQQIETLEVHIVRVHRDLS